MLEQRSNLATGMRVARFCSIFYFNYRTKVDLVGALNGWYLYSSASFTHAPQSCMRGDSMGWAAVFDIGGTAVLTSRGLHVSVNGQQCRLVL